MVIVMIRLCQLRNVVGVVVVLGLLFYICYRLKERSVALGLGILVGIY